MSAEIFRATLARTIALHQQVQHADPRPVLEAAAAIVASLRAGGTLIAFGNGGSAADAQHVVAELVGRYERDRRGLAAVALTADASVMTSIGNDYGFERVFARQVEAIGAAGDVALGITTSGRSPNVVAALAAAKARGLQTIALTGRDGGDAGRTAAIHVNVPAESTARVQEVHRTLLHVMCEIVESALVEDERHHGAR